MAELRAITEDNFIDAFNLKLVQGRKASPLTQYAVLRRLMFAGTSVSCSGSMKARAFRKRY